MTSLRHGKVLLLGGALFSALALCGSLISPIGCGSQNTEDPCPGGICTGGDGGTNPDGSMACIENWVCTSFDTSGSPNNQATRTCTDSNACGTTALRPPLTATLPTLDLNFYKCNVEPIFDNKCSQLACHGTETQRALRIYSRGRLRNAAETFTETGCLAAGTKKPAAECIGSIECICWTGTHSPTEWQRNYDSARSFALDSNGQRIAQGTEDTSDLLGQPVIGGKAHTGIHVFRKTDADYMTIKQWLSGQTLATCNTTN
jgi:hypothetical protein